MPKAGILHDYDLMANAEPSAQKDDTVCPICDDAPPRFQWSDYSGQAMCMTCGCIFQLKWGTDEQIKEGKYPYMSLLPEWVPIVREYWNETKKWSCFGTMIGPRPGMDAFWAWVEKNHPEMMKEDKEN